MPYAIQIANINPILCGNCNLLIQIQPNIEIILKCSQLSKNFCFLKMHTYFFVYSQNAQKLKFVGDTVEIFPCPLKKVEHQIIHSSKTLSLYLVRGGDGSG